MYSGDVEGAAAYLLLTSVLEQNLAVALQQLAIVFPESYPLIAAGFLNNYSLTQRLPPAVYVPNIALVLPTFAILPLGPITYSTLEIEEFLNIEWQ